MPRGVNSHIRLHPDRSCCGRAAWLHFREHKRPRENCCWASPGEAFALPVGHENCWQASKTQSNCVIGGLQRLPSLPGISIPPQGKSVNRTQAAPQRGLRTSSGDKTGAWLLHQRLGSMRSLTKFQLKIHCNDRRTQRTVSRWRNTAMRRVQNPRTT